MFDNEKRAFVAISEDTEVCLVPKMANRHGLITGATGTGKTVTLQTLAETFSRMGVPVFAADVKGDLSGVAAVGGNKESVTQRVETYGLADKGFTFQAFPVQFWDVFGEQGAPVRATIADMGPLLLSRLLSLNDTQSAVLTIIFKIAKDESMEIIDLKDLQKLLEYVGNNASRFTTAYGNISTASIGAIQRGLITLEHDGADKFFGEPNLNIDDLIQTVGDKGVINILASDKLMNSPRVYTTFLMWLMTKLFDVLPEVGDPDKPKLVFFFDEAHLLFADAQKALLEKIEQVVRLIRSKGVGIYFISQTPSDIPDSVLGQLGNRVQHALRAYTPKDQKAVKVAAQTFRANPKFDTESAIMELGTGEALVSFLDEKGRPNPVERAYILPPEGQIGPLDTAERNKMTTSSLLYRHYAQLIDRTSAFEILTERLQNTLSEKEQVAKDKADAKAQKELEKARREEEKAAQKRATENKRFWNKMATTVFVPIAKQVVNILVKGASKKK
ncbi:DNA helicase HerA-like ATPase [Parabacteroides sp. PF5-5]|uniref:helicase HerA-like domain-containing protein n=1 Tax=unclassified Parabacteroides TaxID=2649774 RepID=UPI002476E53C|nr:MULTISPECIES: helicase HerA-like domain-containing protein [unclassified Parabacteroides]MDH6304266.1 DNA helicase HerA-like ATPase [Parabacteroides sp. PH5-39]MDH6315019.1 DNA helicase HerA-like ATPase [Parabacteroides sp. PF5-13]MDH6318679.1 DNA helicase HerA-like ATPase [Parabacteroides sp. PH5-13]MDH6322409.1 DNA helicase HerA-like ATPase [Parabacteroides sp. PH5-8]MDH6326456.1 DNA helicase HerA-like ATPase [Parabacteroides sp. PH5-41]